MISVFDIVNLKKLLKDFYVLSKIRITVFDEEFKEIVSYPNNIPVFCSIIRSDPTALHNCKLCDERACQRAKTLKKNYIYSCHAGLTESITPIIIGNLIIGYMLFGHIAQYPDKEEGWNHVQSKCENYNINMLSLKESYHMCKYFSVEHINAATQIMETVASYLCVSHMARLKYDSLPIQIDTYITDHFSENISIENLSTQFEISRTKLYQIAAQNYGIGIAEYIRNLRIEKSKQLLLETTMPIKEIASVVGIDDYNYFSKVFKNISGKTPRAFRYNR
ncbi:MAG: PocR ligand-binding domain-containing protein [Lachnotalea sp.]